MATELKYKLYGYIEYLPTSVGFVTPVFENNNNFYLQVKSFSNRYLHWEELSKDYEDFIKPDLNANINSDINSLIYTFKWKHTLFTSDGEKMATYLSKYFLPSSEDEIEIAKAFIREWPKLELNITPFTKEEIWKHCLNEISIESKTLPQILEREITVEEFKNNILLLKTKSVAVKDVFEKQFLDIIINKLTKEIPEFQIQIEIPPQLLLPDLPFVYFGGEASFHNQGSFILQASINPYQSFENFIVADFNKTAYLKSQDFIENNSSRFIGVKGEWGIGKSHLVNSIAQVFSQSKGKKVGFFRVLNYSNRKKFIPETEIEHFKINAFDNDIIIIDDIDQFIGNEKLLKGFIQLLNEWSKEGKRFILSFRNDDLFNDCFPRFSNEYQEVNFINPTKEDKIKIFTKKIENYNIQISRDAIFHLSEKKEVSSISDIQKALIKAYLSEEVSFENWNFFLTHTHKNIDHFLPKHLESSVSKYFKLHLKGSNSLYDETHSINALVITNFISYLFQTAPRRSNHYTIPKIVRDSSNFLYSLEAMQHHVFENDRFKEIVVEVLRDIVKNSE